MIAPPPPSDLLTPTQLFGYQRECVLHMLFNDDSMLWLQMGLGKTPITLTVIVDRMRAQQVKKTIIFGPLRVIQAVWAREARKWTHTKHLRFSVLHGPKEKRLRALFTDADIYLCNYESMNWLAETLDHYYLSQNKPLPFEMCVYDEVSKMKNSTALRMSGGNRDRTDRRGEVYKIKVTGWRKILPHFKYRVGLTGTPASNGYLDLHGQYLAVDGGKRLGEFITHYKDSYFASDYQGRKYTPTDIGKQWIEYQISDITKKMDAKDYLDLPACRTTDILVDLPPKARKAYIEMEKQMFSRLESGTEVEVFSKSSISNKCLQFCNGSPYYGETKEWEALHDAKLDALEEVLEEAAGAPVLCSYSFKSDAERIMKKFAKLKPVNLTAIPSAQTESYIDKWNRGEIKLMIGHPACLHPRTKVLTEQRGWVKIVDVRHDERVFDGVEFVSHRGCHYSGTKEVIDVFGVTMTPDHKLLIEGEWVEGQHAGNIRDARAKALYQYEGDDRRVGEMFTLCDSGTNTEAELHQAQQEGEYALQPLHRGHVSPHDGHADLADLAGNEDPRDVTLKTSGCEELCGEGDLGQRGVDVVRELLPRHARWVHRQLDAGEGGRERTLLQGELSVGDEHGAAGQQAQQQDGDIQGGGDPSGRAGEAQWAQQDDAAHATEPRDVGGRSGGGRDLLPIREGQATSPVYDLVDCGPRHRFLIQNDEGEVFISHNSMGHGVDGLQQSGSIVVWFGVNWSLELYEQMNARIDRQGQKSPVSIIRILCKDSVDLAVVDAIERKVDDQEGLKAALQRYRDGITTNDLEVNFY